MNLPTYPVRPDFDAVAAHPEMRDLRDAASAGTWSAIEAFFAEVADPDARAFAQSVLSEVEGIEDVLDAQIDGAAGASLPAVLQAARHVRRGWDARSGQMAGEVSREQFDRFNDHLRRAEQLLIEVIAREPNNIDAWHWRMPTARGLELGLSEAQRRIDRVHRGSAHHYFAESHYLQQICPKWGGDWDRVHEFATACMTRSPAGTLSPVVVVQGHLERWIDLGGEQAGEDYLSQPRVVDEVTAAAYASVLHASYRPTYGWVEAHGYFAMFFSLVRRDSWAAVHFRTLGNFASDAPWKYFNDPAAAFNARRDLAFVAGGAA